jgi:hypothetical protein
LYAKLSAGGQVGGIYDQRTVRQLAVMRRSDIIKHTLIRKAA